MRVNIVDTGNAMELNLMEGCYNKAKEFLGSWGALDDGQFIYDEETNAYSCDQETYDWWSNAIQTQQKIYSDLGFLEGHLNDEQMACIFDDAMAEKDLDVWQDIVLDNIKDALLPIEHCVI